jgi:hypothetical protein
MQKVEPEELSSHKIHFSVYTALALLAFMALIILLPLRNSANAFLDARSIDIGSGIPSSVTTHDYSFDSVGAPLIGSVVFEYCDSPLLAEPCVVPLGLDTSGANLTFQSGDTGYSIHPNTSLTANRIVLTRAPVASGAGTKQYQLSNITNPSVDGVTSYVRIFTHVSDDGTGGFDDTGSVAFSVQQVFTVSVYVPPYLAMCVAVTVAVDCSSANGDVVDMGELSKNSANSATTQFAVATNSFTGYSTLLVGATMTAGNRSIPALVTPALSSPGTSQFGINLRANTTPSVGSNVDGVGTGTPAPGYNTPNVFRFQSGDTIASSSLSTEWNRYTISYLVNVANGQPAGRYASTLTVIATTTF